VDEVQRRAFSGRIAQHPETWLSASRFDTLISNLHRAAEICREAGFEPVLHPHAATCIETADEIARVVDRMDTPRAMAAPRRDRPRPRLSGISSG
jgi:sugar phosphate isomerase/epimerase